MSKAKIDEMARSLCLLKKDTCEDCTMNEHCLMRNCAECFYNAGYRKASEVAREIIDDLESQILPSGKGLYDFPVITHEFIAELKKKYTEDT